MSNAVREHVRRVVREFTLQYYQELQRRIGQMVPGADANVMMPDGAWEDPFHYMMEPQEWLHMALYGQGLAEGDAGEMYEVCQSLAEWMFALPNASTYHIPDAWYETEMGALWAAAFFRVHGDELITLKEAADIEGVSISAIAGRIDRGSLRAYIDPTAENPKRDRRKVRRSDVEPSN